MIAVVALAASLAVVQDQQWEAHQAAGRTAAQQGRYAEAANEYLIALQSAEVAFRPEAIRLVQSPECARRCLPPFWQDSGGDRASGEWHLV